MDFRSEFIKELTERYLNRPSNSEKLDKASQVIINWFNIILSDLHKVQQTTDDLELFWNGPDVGCFAFIRFKNKTLSFERTNETINVLLEDNGEKTTIDKLQVDINVVSEKHNQACTVSLLDIYLNEVFSGDI